MLKSISLSSFVFSRSAYQTTPAVLKRFCGYVAWVHTQTHTHACTVIALIISCFLFVHKELGPSPESDFAKEGQGKERGLQGREGEEKAICWLRSMITQVLLFGWHHTDIFSTDLSSPLTVLSSSFLAACNQNHTAIHFPTVSLSCLFLGVMSKQKCFPR